MRQNTGGRNQYHAGIVKFEKEMSNGWGGRINYTYSRLMDNQFGEGNFFSSTPAVGTMRRNGMGPRHAFT